MIDYTVCNATHVAC